MVGILIVVLQITLMTVNQRLMIIIGMNLVILPSLFFPGIKSKGDPVREGERGVRNVDSRKEKTMGGIGGQSCNKHYDRRSKVSIQRETRAFGKSPLKQNNFNKDGISFRRIHPKVAGNKHNKGNYRSNSVTLFHNVYETQEKWQDASNYRFKGLKRSPVYPKVQDGDSSCYSKHYLRGSLGLFGGFKGRLFSFTNQEKTNNHSSFGRYS